MIISLAGKRCHIKFVERKQYQGGMTRSRVIHARPDDQDHLFAQLVLASLQTGGVHHAFTSRQLLTISSALANILLPTLQEELYGWADYEGDVKYVRMAGIRVPVKRKRLKAKFLGYFDSCDNYIAISEQVKPHDQYVSVLFHECVHAALRRSGATQLIDASQEEVVAENLEQILLPALLKHRGVLDVSSQP